MGSGRVRRRVVRVDETVRKKAKETSRRVSARNDGTGEEGGIKTRGNAREHPKNQPRG